MTKVKKKKWIMLTVFQRVLTHVTLYTLAGNSLNKYERKYSLECLLFLEKYLSYHFIIRHFLNKFLFILEFIKYI